MNNNSNNIFIKKFEFFKQKRAKKKNLKILKLFHCLNLAIVGQYPKDVILCRDMPPCASLILIIFFFYLANLVLYCNLKKKYIFFKFLYKKKFWSPPPPKKKRKLRVFAPNFSCLSLKNQSCIFSKNVLFFVKEELWCL